LFREKRRDGFADKLAADDVVAARLTIVAERAEFLRSPHVLAPGLLKAAFADGLQWIHEPLVAEGRVELTRWLREQSLSETRHRHGQLPTSERA
jgi:RHH-type proline utilization regulon transcriptional repressor/proline dehydrogenase/delta 1-pyrroline-5-carboxylate dehydrogenase